MTDKESQMTPSEEEIAYGIASFIGELGKRGKDQEDKTRILFSAAINSVMLFIAAIKLTTGDNTETCRKNVMRLMDEQIKKSDADGDEVISWHDGEAQA